MSKFRLGHDVEVFLFNQELKKHIAINGFINAGKHDPLQIPNAPQGFTLQEDNVALEYGVPPAATVEEWVNNCMYVMERSKEWLPSNLTFSKLSCTIFTDDQLEHPLSRVFGCEPDFNAYTKMANPSPRPPHPGMRSAGGHIHYETQADKIDLVKNLDLNLGVASVLMDEGEQRKQLYGKAGAHRPKPYGVEYRTLSNFWIHEKKFMEWVWRCSERAFEEPDMFKYTDRVEECINTNNKGMAEALVKEFNLELA
jgi:hypothetical protein